MRRKQWPKLPQEPVDLKPAMAKTLVIPSFASEAEEAEWYQAHKQEVEKEFMCAWKEVRTFRASGRGRTLKPVTIRLSEDDIDAARKQGGGGNYQTLINSALRDSSPLKCRWSPFPRPLS
jgi:uncharacterized protein (DUF4415 family)